MSRDGDGNLKEGPCGKAGSTRGTHVYTYEPGATITIKLVETIPHPSYFRIAFDDDGDDGFEEPASIKPIDPNRKCPDGPGDHCGEADFYNNDTVLAGMDNLNPHMPSAADYLNGPTYTWQVTLPDVECDNCTLQIIQVMEDDGPHGPYDPTPGVGVADIYHQCIDLVLKRGTGEGGPSTGGGGGEDGGVGTGGDGAGDGSSGDGVDTGNGDGTDQGGHDSAGGTPTDSSGGSTGGNAGQGSGASSSNSGGGCSLTMHEQTFAERWGASLVLLGLAAWRGRRRVRALRSVRGTLAQRRA